MAAYKTLRRFCVMSYNQPPLYLVSFEDGGIFPFSFNSHFNYGRTSTVVISSFTWVSRVKRENFGYVEKNEKIWVIFGKKREDFGYIRKNFFFGKRASRRYNGEILRFYFGKGLSRRYKWKFRKKYGTTGKMACTIERSPPVVTPCKFSCGQKPFLIKKYPLKRQKYSVIFEIRSKISPKATSNDT